MKQNGTIRITGRGTAAVIDIEGTIGVPEWWQFENDEERIATYDRFRSEVEQIRQNQAERLTVNIRSLGGEVQDALLIYEALRELPAEVTTVCYGYVASAATIIAQAASEGRRMISSNALYLIHNATTTLEGNANDASRTAELLGKTDERIAAIYAERSGQPAETFRELMNRDGGHGEWLAPDEVIGYGLADKIHAPSPLAAVKQRVRDLFERAGAATTRLLEESVPTGSATGSSSSSEMLLADLERQIGALRNRVGELDAENARLSALPSATLPREDPEIDPIAATAAEQNNRNRNAYGDDAQLFR